MSLWHGEDFSTEAFHIHLELNIFANPQTLSLEEGSSFMVVLG